jgi:general secretion pathway protein G
MMPALETSFRAVGPGEGCAVAMHENRRQSGFTLIELMTVIAIIGILVGVAVPAYKNSIISAKEAVLMEDLRIMADAIEQYNADKATCATSLQDLVDKGYLKMVPKDPIQRDAVWIEEPCPPSSEPGAETMEETCLCAVRSGAAGTSLLYNVPYGEL